MDWLVLRLDALLRRFRKRVTRAENSRHLHRLRVCGEGTALWGAVTITGHENIELGCNVHIGAGAFIRGEGGIVIGDNTHISRNLVLYTMNHRFEGDCLPYDSERVLKSVRIGRNVWIGMNVCLTPGCHIGDGAIVGMGTVVAGTVPPGAIVGSQKWRVLGERNSERYAVLDSAAHHAGPSGRRFQRSEAPCSTV